ncbi:MAG TPA: cellulose synthase [Trebonia sp.]|jgi:hypothetical protein|nr:cellulose synthase [Trebonia sp.]
MSTYSQIAWLPLCAGVTGVGLVGSYLVYRKRGFASGLRWVAWSLLPLAAYLTQSVQTLWDMGVKLVDFATGFVFSPERWAGIALVGLAFVAFVVSGVLRRGRALPDGETDGGGLSGRAAKRDTAAAGGAPKRQALERRSAKQAAKAGDDDDFSEIEKILRDRGIS